MEEKQETPKRNLLNRVFLKRLSNNSGRYIKCPNCNYKWATKSKMINVTCPNCQLKVKTTNDKRQNENNVI